MPNSQLSTARARRAPGRRRALAASNVYATDLDHRRLRPLADAAAEVSQGAAVLQDKLDRALVLAADEAPLRVVRLESVVSFRAGAEGPVRTVQLVLPEAADIDENRVSVLAPVGAALFGLPVGATFRWDAGDGVVRSVTVLDVVGDHGEAGHGTA